MKSTAAEPVITTSLVLPSVTSVIVIVPVPAVSIPMALFAIDTLSKAISLADNAPYLNAAPAELVTVPDKSPVISLT